MELDKTLYDRLVPGNLDTPRVCHITAAILAGQNSLIPDDVREAVVNSALQGKRPLEDIIDEVNKLAAETGVPPQTIRENYLRLIAQMAFSQGVVSENSWLNVITQINISLHKYDPNDWDITE